jgi:hypothetical protein
MHAGKKLPPGVERVRSGRRTYYYWNPNRGTSREGERVALPNADTDPAAFWREVDRYVSSRPTLYPAYSIGAMVEAFFASEECKTLSESTRANYMVHGNRFKKMWGVLPARGLPPSAVLVARDVLKDTAPQANHMLAFGRTLWNWGIPRDYALSNPFDKISDLEIPDRGHVPWPSFAIEFVYAHAPEDFVRAVRLGIMTCQRESDLIRMGPEQRAAGGIWCRPKKTRKRRKSFLIPLSIADKITLDRWADAPIPFENTRYKKPWTRHNPDLYFYSPRGVAYTENSLRARYHRWLGTPKGKELCRLWQEWLKVQVRKYEWDIAAEDVKSPTIHGLRGTGILLRFANGADVDQIANDIGMTRQTVDRYMRFRDQMEVATGGGARRLRLVEKA